MKKITKLLSFVLLLALLLTGCGGEESKTKEEGTGTGETTTEEQTTDETSTGEKIKIGGLAPLTGEVAVYGITSTNGTKMAFEEINAAGGVMGKEIEFILYDEKGDPMEAVTAYEKLVQDEVVALIGDVTSKPSVAVAESTQELGMPMITPTGTQDTITLTGPNVFRVCFTDSYQGEVLAVYAKETLGAKTAAVMKNSGDDYSDGIAQAFVAKAKELGIEIVAEEAYADADKDFKPQLTKIAAAKPDVLLAPDYYEKDALIAQQGREVGFEGTYIGGDGWDGVVAAIHESSRGAIEGVRFSNHYALSDPSEKVQNFIKNYKEKYNEDPSSFAALGYDAAHLMAQAIEKAQSTEMDKIVEALQTIEFEGVTGKLKFDENGDPIKAVSIINITDGKYELDQKVEAE